jgi:hypothetical protein
MMTDKISSKKAEKVFEKAARLSIKLKETNDYLTIEELTEAAQSANIDLKYVRQALAEVQEDEIKAVSARKEKNVRFWQIFSECSQGAIALFCLCLLGQVLGYIFNYQPQLEPLVESRCQANNLDDCSLMIIPTYVLIKGCMGIFAMAACAFVSQISYFVIERIVDFFKQFYQVKAKKVF